MNVLVFIGWFIIKEKVLSQVFRTHKDTTKKQNPIKTIYSVTKYNHNSIKNSKKLKNAPDTHV